MCSYCDDPHALSAQDCSVWKKEKEIQHISFPEAKQPVEVRVPTVVSVGVSYSTAFSTKNAVKSVRNTFLGVFALST